MKKLVRTSVWMFALALAGSTAAPLLATPTSYLDHDHDRDEHAYWNNRYYKQGWNEGSRHKHKNHKWHNDEDRRAYEAGYFHGDRNERWQDHRDHDHH